MIGGLLTIFVACWVYQGAVSVKRDNVIRWVMIGAFIFYFVQLAWLGLDIFFFVSNVDTDKTDSLVGSLHATYRELMPAIVGFLATAVFRTKIVMQEKLSIANLFSGAS